MAEPPGIVLRVAPAERALHRCPRWRLVLGPDPDPRLFTTVKQRCAQMFRSEGVRRGPGGVQEGVGSARARPPPLHHRQAEVRPDVLLGGGREGFEEGVRRGYGG
eukprot:369612-Prorocentrum_minimum.AAC.1